MTTTPTIWKDSSHATDDTGIQFDGQIVGLPDGGYFIAWEDFEPSDSLIVGQRFNILGQKVGQEITLGQITGDDAVQPAIAVLSGGGIAVAFVTGLSLVVHRYDAKMHLVGTDAIDTAAGLNDASIVGLDNGAYAVSYRVGAGSDTDIVANVVSHTGVVGPRFDVLNETDNSEKSEIAKLSNGNFVVVMQDEKAGDSADNDIKYGIFMPSGTQVGSTVTVFGTTNASNQTLPDVAALQGGGFVVVWQDDDGDAAGNAGIHATIYDNAGTLVQGNITVNTSTSGIQNHASVIPLAAGDGGFVVVWEDQNSDLNRAQRFDANGTKIGAEFTVKSDVSGDAADIPAAALLGDGRIAFSVGTFLNPGDSTPDHVIFDPRTAPIAGTSGRDFLTSRQDGAIIKGLGGNDALYAALGHDVLIGGRGADKFVFSDVLDSAVGAGRDVIRDFHHTQHDRINLRGIDANSNLGGNQAFHFIDAQAFQHHAGQLRFAGGKVQGDVDGDGHADFEIKVPHAHLVQGDFLL